MSAPFSFASDLLRALDERQRADTAEFEARVASAKPGEFVESDDGRFGALVLQPKIIPCKAPLDPDFRRAIEAGLVPGMTVSREPRA